jgi:hypothetical protein
MSQMTLPAIRIDISMYLLTVQESDECQYLPVEVVGNDIFSCLLSVVDSD